LTCGQKWCYTTVENVKSFIQESGVCITEAPCGHRHADDGILGWCRKEEVMRKEVPGWYMAWVQNKASECEKNYDGVVSTPDN